MTIPEKITSIVADINKGVYDKECELKLALLAACEIKEELENKNHPNLKHLL